MLTPIPVNTSMKVQPNADKNKTGVNETVKRIYQTALAPTDKTSKEIYAELLKQVVENLEFLLQPGNGSALKEVFVMLIMSNKEDISITQYDIIQMLDDLKNEINSTELLQGLTTVEQGGLEHLLDAGIALYNHKTHKNVTLKTFVCEVPCVDLAFELFSKQALTDQISLAETNRFHSDAFNRFCISNDRHILSTEDGKQYINKRGIGPLSRQRLMMGETSVKELLQLKEEKLKKIQERLADEDEDVQQIVGSRWMLEYIVDDSISIERAISHAINYQYDGLLNFSSVGIRKYINNGSLPMEDALTLSGEGRSNLDSAAIQKYIDNGSLTVAQGISFSYQEWHDLEFTGVLPERFVIS